MNFLVLGNLNTDGLKPTLNELGWFENKVKERNITVQPTYRDAERTNDSPRSAKIYKDLNLLW